jgi:hypothetical protein
MAAGFRGFRLNMAATVHHWRKSSVTGDLVRGALGTVACGLAVMSFAPFSPGQIAFALPGLLFASYLASTTLKLFSHVSLDDESVALARPLFGVTRISWRDVPSFSVRHFSLGQLQRKTLMDLKISNGTSTILLDDGLEDFPAVLRKCWACASAHGVGVSEATLANLAAIGCATPATRSHG